ncbi:heterokaryon incompatibility protein-domain-containing protein [Thelonectria olida]|uniref:Heterokaryon incompatibility protein-domain-containing protein n=1 Tax=Thelonectria olida TaxID=1576542 RepID=A0A9P8W2U1_9HYPO|nr:heterokaryon incompatibility protein-domain-containing protein [Thelonectria olida]
MSQQVSHATDAQNVPPDDHYEYGVLQDKHFIRYLILQPSSLNSDPLVCTLHTAHLDDIPRFEAMSYVWGTPAKNQSVTCDGKVIRITANLHDALRQVRFEDKLRTLWVDSICINQADPKEQGHQVSLMERIYRKASCTLICLGTSDRVHAPAVADLVTGVDRMIQNVFGRADFEWCQNSFPFPDDGEPLVSHSGWDSFSIMLQQPWFKRGWVVQEAALGRDAVVLWADTAIEWLSLVRAYVWGIRRALKLPDIQHFWLSDLHLQGLYGQRSREAITFRPEGAAKPLTLLETLDGARWLGVTDPRDRIYAFLSVLSSSILLPAIRPNYEVPYIHVYRDFACEYLRTSKDLDILHFVHSDESTLKSDFPSWIPRWDMHLYSSYTGTLNNYNSHSRHIVSKLSSPTVTVSSDQNTLELRAVMIDTVRFTGRGFDKRSTTPDDVASLWESVFTASTPVLYSCSALRAFVTIFRCGIYRGILREWKAQESAYMRLLQRELTPGDASYGTAEYFHRLRMEDVHNKSFIVSDRGYYGLAPNVVQEGDVCCIIFGTRSPFILRRTDRAGHYKLVGSVLILSKKLDHNGNPERFGGDEVCQDWVEWGLEEETIVLY